MKLKVLAEYPPIPIRNLDWRAWDDDTLDICNDPECKCRLGVVQGLGASAEEALMDFVHVLLEKTNISVSRMMAADCVEKA